MDGPQISQKKPVFVGIDTFYLFRYEYYYLGKAVTSKQYCILQGPFNFKDTLGAIITCANGIVILLLHPRYSWGWWQ